MRADTISITATVPLTPGFVSLVSQKSFILAKNKVLIINQQWEVEVVVSDGKLDLKNQEFVCEIKKSGGKIIGSQKGNTGETARGEIKFNITSEMIGKDELECQVISYAEPIVIDQRTSLVVFPEIGMNKLFF